jgi:phage FluMu protein Com
MTSETKTFIQFSDLVAVETRCPNCNTCLVHKVEGFDYFRSHCPHCKYEWLSTPDVEYIRDFFYKLAKVKQTDGFNKLFRIQVSNEAVHG